MQMFVIILITVVLYRPHMCIYIHYYNLTSIYVSEHVNTFRNLKQSILLYIYAGCLNRLLCWAAWERYFRF